MPHAELQRDAIRLGLRERDLEIFERGLREALEQLELFPESGTRHELGGGREDFRRVVFGPGYRLVYALPSPDEVLVFSVLPPWTGQAFD